MAKSVIDADAILSRATPLAHQQAHEIQPVGQLVQMPIAWFVAEHVVEVPSTHAV